MSTTFRPQEPPRAAQRGARLKVGSAPAYMPQAEGPQVDSAPPGSVAAKARALVAGLLGPDLPIRFSFWDGSSLGPADSPGTIRVRSVDAIRRILWSPDEIGLSRAYVVGDLDVDGDILSVLAALRSVAPSYLHFSPSALVGAFNAARELGAIRRPLPPPTEESSRWGIRHSRRRDARAISHHYDVGNGFYRLVLGPAMTYSCARFVDDNTTLADAQAAKHELICRKLGLHERPGARLLDVGCGWGSLAIHAARYHHATVTAITISREQADLARRRVTEAGLDELVEIRLQDYRDLGRDRFDAISSVGMFEHVGSTRMAEYFTSLRGVLDSPGRLLNHAISSIGGSPLRGRTFVGRYVFPDGELIDVGEVVLAMETAGFEVRDVESLREHYAQTLRAWVANLESAWDEAVELVGPARARIWRLYMAGSALGFEDGGLGLHQVLGVAGDAEGNSAMPPTRRSWD